MNTEDTLRKTETQSFKRYSKVLEPLLTKPQNRVYTATILSFLVVSLFLWYAVRPTLQTILSLRREIIDNIEVSKLMEEKISALVQAQATYQDIQADLPLLDQALPETPEPISALLALKSLATATNASISGVQLPKVDLDNSTASLSANTSPSQTPHTIITLNVDGTYTTMKAFLDGIMNLRRIMAIHSLFISSSTDTTSSTSDPTLSLVLKLEIYHNPKGATL